MTFKRTITPYYFHLETIIVQYAYFIKYGLCYVQLYGMWKNARNIGRKAISLTIRKDPPRSGHELRHQLSWNLRLTPGLIPIQPRVKNTYCVATYLIIHFALLILFIL